MRAHWFQEDPGRKFSVPPLKTWSGANLLMATLGICFILQLVPGVTWALALHMDQVANPVYWYQFLTYALIHSQSDILHLLFNVLMFFFFGRQIEADLGGRNPFLVFCGLAAVVASISFVTVELLSHPDGASWLLGASGMAYACLVAFGTLYPQAQVVLLIFPMRAWALVAIIFGAALWSSLFGAGAGDGVAHVAHLGGGAFGFLFIRYRFKAALLVEGYRRKRRETDQRRSVDRKQEVDRILEKISASGIGSLTKAERKFLDSASRDLRNPR